MKSCRTARTRANWMSWTYLDARSLHLMSITLSVSLFFPTFWFVEEHRGGRGHYQTDLSCILFLNTCSHSFVSKRVDPFSEHFAVVRAYATHTCKSCSDIHHNISVYHRYRIEHYCGSNLDNLCFQHIISQVIRQATSQAKTQLCRRISNAW